MSNVFLNGVWLPIEKATVSVLDRGFIFGDGVYEVIPVYHRRPYRMKPHLLRLQHSLNGIRIKNPYSDNEWVDLINKLISLQNFDDQSIYFQITRGVAPRAHNFPKDEVSPTVFMMSSPLKRSTKQQVEQGIRVVSAQDERWLHCNYKTISLLGNILASQYACDNDAMEVVQFRNGFLTEASSSNVIIVQNGELVIPQKNHLILHGITMEVITEIAQQEGIAVRYEDIPESAVRKADEILITSSTKEVLAATMLDDQPVGQGVPGPVFKRLYTALQKDIFPANE
ncbi:MAG: D-amino acid aminotransferase [Pseudomonadota bacterium]